MDKCSFFFKKQKQKTNPSPIINQKWANASLIKSVFLGGPLESFLVRILLNGAPQVFSVVISLQSDCRKSDWEEQWETYFIPQNSPCRDNSLLRASGWGVGEGGCVAVNISECPQPFIFIFLSQLCRVQFQEKLVKSADLKSSHRRTCYSCKQHLNLDFQTLQPGEETGAQYNLHWTSQLQNERGERAL